MPEEAKAQTNTRRNTRRNEFIQTRKSVPYSLQVQSNAMLDYMHRHGGAAAGAFQRVAGLIQFTSGDQIIRERVDTWLDGVISQANERAEALEVQQQKYSEGVVCNVPRPIVPSNYKHTIEITHPVFWKLIALVESLDSVMGEIEYLWLSGQLEEIHLENARGNAVNTIRRLVNRIYHVTNASRNRKGGLYSQNEFEALMKALASNEDSDDETDTDLEIPVADTSVDEAAAASAA